MKNLTLFVSAVLMVLYLALPAFAANQNGYLNPNAMLTDTSTLAGFPVGGNSSDRVANSRNFTQNELLIDTSAVAGFPVRNQSMDEHYGLAPKWDNRGGSSGSIFGNYRAWNLPGVNDNTGN
jgi:hypothetical protein